MLHRIRKSRDPVADGPNFLEKPDNKK